MFLIFLVAHWKFRMTSTQVAATCYLFTGCKWSSLRGNVLPTSVAVVIELKDNTQTNTDRHRQADTGRQSDTECAAGKHRDIITASICNALCSSQFDLLHCWHIAGNFVANLLSLLLLHAGNCRSHSEATMQQRVVITLARVHGFAGVTCVISLSFLHMKIINFTFHNFICHNSSSF